MYLYMCFEQAICCMITQTIDNFVVIAKCEHLLLLVVFESHSVISFTCSMYPWSLCKKKTMIVTKSVN